MYYLGYRNNIVYWFDPPGEGKLLDWFFPEDGPRWGTVEPAESIFENAHVCHGGALEVIELLHIRRSAGYLKTFCECL